MKRRIDKSSRAKCPSPCQSSDIICFVWVTFLPRFTAASFCSVLLHSKQWSQRWNEMIHFLPAFPAMLQRSVQPGHLPNRHRGQQMRHAQRSFKPCIKFWLMQPENILRTWQRSKHGLHGLWSSRIIIHPIMGIQMYGYTIPQNGQFTQLSTMARKCTRRNNADAETASQKYCSNV